MTSDFSKNPFDGKVVVIEEAHNFVSRIANKLTSKASGSLSLRLYEYLMSAKDCKVVMLTGINLLLTIPTNSELCSTSFADTSRLSASSSTCLVREKSARTHARC